MTFHYIICKLLAMSPAISISLLKALLGISFILLFHGTKYGNRTAMTPFFKQETDNKQCLCCRYHCELNVHQHWCLNICGEPVFGKLRNGELGRYKLKWWFIPCRVVLQQRPGEALQLYRCSYVEFVCPVLAYQRTSQRAA